MLLTDKEIFCNQIRLYEKAMYSLAYSIVKNETDAGEVLSESIFRAYKKMDTLRDDNAFKPWVLRIVYNTAVELIRTDSKTAAAEPADIPTASPDSTIETKISLEAALNTLKQPYRTAVILYYYEDMTISQIAKITGAAQATVKQRLSRARKQLKEALKEDFANG